MEGLTEANAINILESAGFTRVAEEVTTDDRTEDGRASTRRTRPATPRPSHGSTVDDRRRSCDVPATADDADGG